MNTDLPGRFRSTVPLLAALGLAACDGDPVELIEEINAVRAECTEEMLKQADEVCVRMFERYAEMGEDALETYVGGIRALDEALRRRGGLGFDTAGLGRALSLDAWTLERDTFPSTDALESRPLELAPHDGGPDRGGWYVDPRWPTAADRDPPVAPRVAPRYGAPPNPDPWLRREPGASPAAGRRGVLLPPEERLRRPWIGDEAGSTPYLEDGARGVPYRGILPPPPPAESPGRFGPDVSPDFRSRNGEGGTRRREVPRE